MGFKLINTIDQKVADQAEWSEAIKKKLFFHALRHGSSVPCLF